MHCLCTVYIAFNIKFYFQYIVHVGVLFFIEIYHQIIVLLLGKIFDCTARGEISDFYQVGTYISHKVL